MNFTRSLLLVCVVGLAVPLLGGCSGQEEHPNDLPCQDFFDAVNQMGNDLGGPSGPAEANWRAQAEKDLAWMKRATKGATGDVKKSVEEILSFYPDFIDNHSGEVSNRYSEAIGDLGAACIASGFDPAMGRRNG